MRYSIEPRERRYIKGYGFMSFARNFSDKYSKSLMDKGIDVSKKFAKTAGKKVLKETTKATGDLIGNKIADKITSASKKMKFFARKKIIANIYRIQAYDSIMCSYFCIGFINFMFNGKSLKDYTDLFSPNDLKKTMI